MSWLKKIRLKSVVLIVLLCSVLFSQDPNRGCFVQSIVGTVKVRREKSAAWSDARLRMPLRENDAIRTFIESQVELEMVDGTLIKIGENTTVEMAALKGNNNVQNTKLRVLNGTVIANVKKLVNSKSTFDFETPTATAAIRGTTVDLDVTGDRTVIKVFDGKVWVAPLGSTQGAELNDHQMTIVQRGQKKIIIVDISRNLPQDTSSSEASSDTLGSPDSLDVRIEEAGQSRNDSVDLNQTKEMGIELEVVSPLKNSTFISGALINVVGKVRPGKSEISVNGKSVQVDSEGNFKTVLQAPSKKGEYKVRVRADHNLASETIERLIIIHQTPAAGLSVLSPAEGLEIAKPSVLVSGTAYPGALVTAHGIRMNVHSNGLFSGEIPLPDEEGVVHLEIEMHLEGGRSVKVVRNVSYRPEFRLILQTPTERQIVTSVRVPVKGELYPSASELILDGRRIPVASNGSFSTVHVIADQEGEVRLEFEALHNGQSRKETPTIVYRRAADTQKPVLQGVLPEVSKQRRIAFTVVDHTPDEEITFHREIDGIKDNERGPANTPFYLTLENGIHDYVVYALDKAGNQTPRLSRKVAYLESPAWNIKLRKPTGDLVVNIPPSAPDQDFKPVFMVELSVENLPEDNAALIKEVLITNSATKETVVRRNLTSVDVEGELVLDRKRPNIIVVQVRDINDVLKVRQFTINIK